MTNWPSADCYSVEQWKIKIKLDFLSQNRDLNQLWFSHGFIEELHNFSFFSHPLLALNAFSALVQLMTFIQALDIRI